MGLKCFKIVSDKFVICARTSATYRYQAAQELMFVLTYIMRYVFRSAKNSLRFKMIFENLVLTTISSLSQCGS